MPRLYKTTQQPRERELRSVSLTGGVGQLNAPVFSGATSVAAAIQPYTLRPPREIRAPILKAPVDKVGPALSGEMIDNFVQSMTSTAIDLVDNIATKDANALASRVQDEFFQELYDSETGYFRLTDEAAVKGKDAAIVQAKEIGNRALEGATPLVRAKAFFAIQKQIEKHTHTISAYAQQQNEVWDKIAETEKENTAIKDIVSTSSDTDGTIAKIDNQAHTLYSGKGIIDKAKRNNFKTKALEAAIEEAYRLAIPDPESDEDFDTDQAHDLVDKLLNKVWEDGYQTDRAAIQDAQASGETAVYVAQNRREAAENKVTADRKKSIEAALDAYVTKNGYTGLTNFIDENFTKPDQRIARIAISHYKSAAKGDHLEKRSEAYYTLKQELTGISSEDEAIEYRDRVRSANLHPDDTLNLLEGSSNREFGEKSIAITKIKTHLEGVFAKTSEIVAFGYEDDAYAPRYTAYAKNMITEAIEDAEDLIYIQGKTYVETMAILNEKINEYGGVKLYAGPLFKESTNDEIVWSMEQLDHDKEWGLFDKNTKTYEDQLEELAYNIQVRQAFEAFGRKFELSAANRTDEKGQPTEPASTEPASTEPVSTEPASTEPDKQAMKQADIPIVKYVNKFWEDLKYGWKRPVLGPYKEIVKAQTNIWEAMKNLERPYDPLDLGNMIPGFPVKQPPVVLPKYIRETASKLKADPAWVTESNVEALRERLTTEIESEFGDKIPDWEKAAMVKDSMHDFILSKMGKNFIKGKTLIDLKTPTASELRLEKLKKELYGEQ